MHGRMVFPPAGMTAEDSYAKRGNLQRNNWAFVHWRRVNINLFAGQVHTSAALAQSAIDIDLSAPRQMVLDQGCSTTAPRAG